MTGAFDRPERAARSSWSEIARALDGARTIVPLHDASGHQIIGGLPVTATVAPET